MANNLPSLVALGFVRQEKTVYRHYYSLTDKGLEKTRNIIAYRTIEREAQNLLYSDIIKEKICDPTEHHKAGLKSK